MFESLFKFGPDWFSGYRRIRKIGQGGMAALYEGEEPKTGKKVIIKILEPSAVPIKKGALWEGELAEGLRHTNLVETYASGRKSGKYYIVMEMLQGPNLKTRSAARDPWLDGKRKDIAWGIAEGLLFMHGRRLVHRDFNSRNIMFRNNGSPIIIDFGLTVCAFDKVTASADRRGTPSYMAPELVLKNQVDQRTDIYAFGIVLYEMVTGRLPFTGESMFDRMQKNVSTDAKPPSDITPGISRTCDTFILKTMARNPEKRFQTIDDVMTHLEYMDEKDFTVTKVKS